MKKKQVLALTAVLILTVSGIVLAQMDQGKETMGDKGMGMMGGGMMEAKKKGSMMGEGMMSGDMMGKGMMGGMVMKSMMEKTMVATSDGGVIVLAGNKLTKYDKDLNVVKEVEIKMDMEGMHKQMMEMMQNCPMMKGMKGQGEEAADSKGAAPSEADHKSHR